MAAVNSLTKQKCPYVKANYVVALPLTAAPESFWKLLPVSCPGRSNDWVKI